MSIWSAISSGLYRGVSNFSNIAYSYASSRLMRSAGISAFDSLYVNLDSPTGFSSCISPYYASRESLALESVGLDSRDFAVSSAITSSIFNNPFSCGYNSFGFGGFGGFGSFGGFGGFGGCFFC